MELVASWPWTPATTEERREELRLEIAGLLGNCGVDGVRFFCHPRGGQYMIVPHVGDAHADVVRLVQATAGAAIARPIRSRVRAS